MGLAGLFALHRVDLAICRAEFVEKHCLSSVREAVIHSSSAEF